MNLSTGRLAPRILRPKLGGRSGSYSDSAASTLNDDIVAFWKLEEASGTRVDEVGSNDLTDNNTVTQAAGKIGNCADFERGNLEYLSTAETVDLDMSSASEFSGVVWVNAESLPSPGCVIVNKGTSLNAGGYEYVLFYNQSIDRFRFVMSLDGDNFAFVNADTFGAPSTVTWYMILFGWDGSEIWISVNNGTRDTAAYTAGPFSGSPFELGRSPHVGGGDNWYWDGLIDACGIWKNKTLSEAEGTELWNDSTGKEYPF